MERVVVNVKPSHFFADTIKSLANSMQPTEQSRFVDRYVKLIAELEIRDQNAPKNKLFVDLDAWMKIQDYVRGMLSINLFYFSIPIDPAFAELQRCFNLAEQLQNQFKNTTKKRKLKDGHPLEQALKNLKKSTKPEKCPDHPHQLFFNYQAMYNHISTKHPEFWNYNIKDEPMANINEGASTSGASTSGASTSAASTSAIVDLPEYEEEEEEKQECSSFFDNARICLSQVEYAEFTRFAREINFTRLTENLCHEALIRVGTTIINNMQRVFGPQLKTQYLSFMERLLGSAYLQRKFIRLSEEYVPPIRKIIQDGDSSSRNFFLHPNRKNNQADNFERCLGPGNFGRKQRRNEPIHPEEQHGQRAETSHLWR